jgi:hypothetical protein
VPHACPRAYARPRLRRVGGMSAAYRERCWCAAAGLGRFVREMRRACYPKRRAARADGSYRICSAMHGTAPEGADDGLSRHYYWESNESRAVAEQALGCVVGAAHEAFNLCAGLFECAAFALKAIAVSAPDPKHQRVAKRSRLGSAFFLTCKNRHFKKTRRLSREENIDWILRPLKLFSFKGRTT